jgi:hypothetical protein
MSGLTREGKAVNGKPQVVGLVIQHIFTYS